MRYGVGNNVHSLCENDIDDENDNDEGRMMMMILRMMMMMFDDDRDDYAMTHCDVDFTNLKGCKV